MAQYTSDVIPKLFSNDIVTYECSCGSHKSIYRIYLCRHCYVLRCRDCVSHEVDSQYCQHCLEYIPTIDAKLKKNKCANCFQCPCCMHTLTTRTILISVPSGDDPNQSVHKKHHYLICFFCRWSTRDVGIPDQLATSNVVWPEIETPNAKRLDVLFDHYKLLAQKEKLEKEKKRIIGPRSAIHLLDKYGITPILSSKVTASLRAKLPLHGTKTSSGVLYPDLKSPPEDHNFEPSVSTNEVEPLDANYYYGSKFDVSKITTLSQRLFQVETQPKEREKLFPVSKMLLVKRSMRCKQCDHNLSKPEYNPSSIKFKIQLSAYYHIPELKLKAIPVLKKLKESKIEITLQNPTPYLLHINFNQIENQENVKLDLPQNQVILSPKDDTADLDIDQNTQVQFKDDPKVISFRKGNKIGVYMLITPKEQTDNLVVDFRLKHDFINTIIQTHGGIEHQPQISWITHKIRFNLGKVDQ